MRNQCGGTEEEVDNGGTTRQIWQEDSTRNRAVRLSKVQEAVPRSPKQEEDLDVQPRFTLTFPPSPFFLSFHVCEALSLLLQRTCVFIEEA